MSEAIEVTVTVTQSASKENEGEKETTGRVALENQSASARACVRAGSILKRINRVRRKTGRSSEIFFGGFENMGDRSWAENALFVLWGGETWVELRYAGDGDSQFAWGGHEKAEK